MSNLRLLLGFDYGTRQIGVAVGQMITGQARELCQMRSLRRGEESSLVDQLQVRREAKWAGCPLLVRLQDISHLRASCFRSTREP